MTPSHQNLRFCQKCTLLSLSKWGKSCFWSYLNQKLSYSVLFGPTYAVLSPWTFHLLWWLISGAGSIQWLISGAGVIQLCRWSDPVKLLERSSDHCRITPETLLECSRDVAGLLQRTLLHHSCARNKSQMAELPQYVTWTWCTLFSQCEAGSISDRATGRGGGGVGANLCRV